VEIVICSRFAFLAPPGEGGTEAKAEALDDLDWLAARQMVFEFVALDSLARQSRQDFHHLILTSSGLPEQAFRRLAAACHRAYGAEDRFTVLARPPGPAKRHLAEFLAERYGTAMVAQVLLAEDDGLGVAFVEDLAPRLDRIAGEVRAGARALPYFLSYPSGCLLDLRGERPEVYRLSRDFIDLGLTMVARPDARNIFGVKAARAPKKFGAEIVEREAMYLRCLHGLRDAGADLPASAAPVAGWRQDAALLEALPSLKRIAAGRG
jgi:hypothetical protein